MQGYYARSPYYPVPAPIPPHGVAPPPPTAQQLANMPYIAGYGPPLPEGMYQRHRYETYVPPPPEPVRPKHMHRSQSVSVPNPNGQRPLKSAMKKRNHERSESMGAPISRQSSRAPEEQRERAGSMTRPRANSIQQFIPDHVFVTLSGSNEIRLENIAFQQTVDELREYFLARWTHGVSSEQSREHTWRATFNGTPWACSGLDFIISRRMICALWGVLANHGYNYLTTSSTSNPPAKLIFVKGTQETPVLFTMSISQSASKFSFLDAPPYHMHILIGKLRDMFPRRITSDRATEDGVMIIEIRKSSTAPEVDRSILTAYILGYFNSIGFKLDGSIPMGKAGPLGFGSKKELWIFRGTQQRSGSASGHNSIRAQNSAHGHGEY